MLYRTPNWSHEHIIVTIVNHSELRVVIQTKHDRQQTEYDRYVPNMNVISTPILEVRYLTWFFLYTDYENDVPNMIVSTPNMTGRYPTWLSEHRLWKWGTEHDCKYTDFEYDRQVPNLICSPAILTEKVPDMIVSTAILTEK